MTLPPGRGTGAAGDDVAGPKDSLGLEAGLGVGVVEGTAEEGRDQPVVLLGCGAAVSFAVTKRG